MTIFDNSSPCWALVTAELAGCLMPEPVRPDSYLSLEKLCPFRFEQVRPRALHLSLLCIPPRFCQFVQMPTLVCGMPAAPPGVWTCRTIPATSCTGLRYYRVLSVYPCCRWLPLCRYSLRLRISNLDREFKRHAFLLAAEEQGTGHTAMFRRLRSCRGRRTSLRGLDPLPGTGRYFPSLQTL